jgi:hypothetical protein
MALIADYVFDAALAKLDIEANRLDICTSEPTTYAQATTAGAVSLGSKTGLSIGAPSDRTPTGRRVTVAAITDGVVSNTGTGAFWAVTDTVNSRLLATGALASTQSVTAGNPFTLPAFDIGIADAT